MRCYWYEVKNPMLFVVALSYLISLHHAEEVFYYWIFYLYNLSFGMIFNNKMHRYTGVLIIILIVTFIYSLLILGEI